MLIADIGLRPESEKLLAEYSDKSPRAVFQKTDVVSWADLDAMFDAALKNFGQIDIVCPGAGVFEPEWSSFWHPPGTAGSKDHPSANRYAIFDINLNHVVRTTQLAISHFLNANPPSSPQNPKTIIIIASIAGEIGFMPVPLYVASKWAVRSLIYSLAEMEGISGIRVAGVAPGVVKTPIWLDAPDKMKFLNLTGDHPDAWVTPEEVAKVMLTLVEKNEMGPITAQPEDAEVNQTKIPIRGGTLLGVAAGTVRNVPLFNNAGPGTIEGNTVGNAMDGYMATAAMLKPGWGKA